MDTRYPITWTVKAVQETLIDAAWHCIASGGRSLPGMAAGSIWISSVTPDEDEREKRLRRRRSPARISFLERAIWWPVKYLADEPECARMMQVWIACKIAKRSFKTETGRMGVARATAYRQRDRAFTLISVGLDRDGVPLWGE